MTTPIGPEPEERKPLALSVVQTHYTTTSDRWLWSAQNECWTKHQSDGTVLLVGKQQYDAFEKAMRGPKGDRLRGIKSQQRLDIIAGLAPVPE